MAFDWRELVKGIAPVLGGAFGGPLGAAALGALTSSVLGDKASGDPVADEARLASVLAGGLTPELRAKILEAETTLKQAAFDLAKQESQAVTERWKADTSTDSWLAKNVRPLVLLYILTAYTILAVGSALDLNVTEAYVQLLGQWGMLIMGAYFGGRTFEKIFKK